MSTLVFKLLIHLCVWTGLFQAYGIQNFHYPTRFNNNQWRVSKRQDLLTKSRLVLWKPALSPGQIYANVKKPAIPLNFNRYGIQSPPIMAPIHQNYMIAIPTKVNYASYQSMKDIEENRKPGNLHHITIINAIMPKPYLSTAPTHSHPAATFQNYRANSKQLHHQYFNNFGRQNMEKLNQINVQQFQLQQQQPQQQLQLVYPSSPLALQINKPTIEYKNVKNYNTNSNDIENEGNEINSPISQCGRKAKDDTNNSASDVVYYYCNNRITNYKNPTQQQLISIQPTTTTTTTTTTSPSTTTSTTTTEIPSTTAKSSHINFNNFSTEKPIFLPTPNDRLENSFVPITSATMLTNSNSGHDDNFNLQTQKKFKPLRQTASRYEDIKRHQPYTTTAPYDSMKFHSFFTIEDAVTRSPEMQVFNDPYQAYRHARRQQINHQRQTITTTKIPETTTTTTTAIPKTKFKSFFDDLDDEDYLQEYRHDRRQHINHQRQVLTTTKIPETTTTTMKPKYKSFFDVLDDEDYFLPEVHQDDYSLFSKPKKSVYHKLDYKKEFEFPKQNRIIDHSHRILNDNDFTTVGETFPGKPKIKEHNFGLFKSIAPTPKPLPVVTTYKPNGNFKGLFATTFKIPSSTPHNNKPLTYTSTVDTVMGNEELVEKENYTPILNEVRTTNTIPMTTTSTEKNFISHTFKPTSNLRSSTPFIYPKQRRLHKPYKNFTSTTTKATTTVKKVPKYQRQYKTKKLKQFKHLYTTTSSTTTTTTTSTTSSTSTSTSTTTTPIPTTVQTHTTTRRPSARLLPTTSTTEEPSTKKTVFSRIFPTTEAPKQKSFRNQTSLTTEATKRKNIKPRTSTASAIKVNDSEIAGRTVRRGSKRAHVAKNEKETTQATMTKASNKNRRRVKSSSTTAKPSLTRSMSGLVSTTTFSSTPTSASHRTSSTTTTMKSIMKISNSKARGKLHNELRYSINTSEMKDDRKELDGRMSVKSITSTMANIPPLPIEIYFKKSHNPKI